MVSCLQPATQDETGIERLGLPGLVQVLGQLPPLEDAFDLSDEGGDFCPELRIAFRNVQMVQELLPDQVFQGFVGPELILDVSGGFALLNPDFGWLHRFTCRVLLGFAGHHTCKGVDQGSLLRVESQSITPELWN